jgi:hypothetical protein
MSSSKKTIVFINAIRPATFKALEKYSSESGEMFDPVIFVDEKIRERVLKRKKRPIYINRF